MTGPISAKFHDLFSDWRGDLLDFTRHKMLKLIVILIAAALALRVIGVINNRVIAFTQREKLPHQLRAQQLRTLAGIIRSLGTFIVFFVALLEILTLFEIRIEPLLASAGIAGLAIGFGAQTLVKDVLNGFFVLIYDEYEIGDVVKIAGVSGTVEQMRLQNTVLRDPNGTLHTIPNSQITIVSNLTRDWTQVALHVAVDYNESSDRVIELLKQVGEELRNDPQYRKVLVADPEVPGIERVSGREVDYLFLAKVRPGSQYAVGRELRRRIKDCLQKNNIRAGTPAQVYLGEPPPQPGV